MWENHKRGWVRKENGKKIRTQVEWQIGKQLKYWRGMKKKNKEQLE